MSDDSDWDVDADELAKTLDADLDDLDSNVFGKKKPAAKSPVKTELPPKSVTSESKTDFVSPPLTKKPVDEIKSVVTQPKKEFTDTPSKQKEVTFDEGLPLDDDEVKSRPPPGGGGRRTKLMDELFGSSKSKESDDLFGGKPAAALGGSTGDLFLGSGSKEKAAKDTNTFGGSASNLVGSDSKQKVTKGFGGSSAELYTPKEKEAVEESTDLFSSSRGVGLKGGAQDSGFQLSTFGDDSGRGGRGRARGAGRSAALGDISDWLSDPAQPPKSQQPPASSSSPVRGGGRGKELALKPMDDWLSQPQESSSVKVPEAKASPDKTPAVSKKKIDPVQELVTLEMKQRQILQQKALEEQEKHLAQLVAEGREIMAREIQKTTDMFQELREKQILAALQRHETFFAKKDPLGGEEEASVVKEDANSLKRDVLRLEAELALERDTLSIVRSHLEREKALAVDMAGERLRSTQEAARIREESLKAELQAAKESHAAEVERLKEDAAEAVRRERERLTRLEREWTERETELQQRHAEELRQERERTAEALKGMEEAAPWNAAMLKQLKEEMAEQVLSLKDLQQTVSKEKALAGDLGKGVLEVKDGLIKNLESRLAVLSEESSKTITNLQQEMSDLRSQLREEERTKGEWNRRRQQAEDQLEIERRDFRREKTEMETDRERLLREVRRLEDVVREEKSRVHKMRAELEIRKEILGRSADPVTSEVRGFSSTVVLEDPELLDEVRRRLAHVQQQEQALTEENTRLAEKRKEVQQEWSRIKAESERLDRISCALEQRAQEVERMKEAASALRQASDASVAEVRRLDEGRLAREEALRSAMKLLCKREGQIQHTQQELEKRKRMLDVYRAQLLCPACAPFGMNGSYVPPPAVEVPQGHLLRPSSQQPQQFQSPSTDLLQTLKTLSTVPPEPIEVPQQDSEEEMEPVRDTRRGAAIRRTKTR